MAKHISFVFIAYSVVFLQGRVVRSWETMGESTPVRFRLTHVGDGYNGLMLPLSVGAQRGRALLSSAGSDHILDLSLQRFVESPADRGRVDGETENASTDVYYCSRVLIGRIPLGRNVQVKLLDLAGIRARTGSNVLAIVGNPFFQNRIVHMEFDEGWLSVLPRSEDVPFSGKSLAIETTKNGVPLIRNAEVGGRKADLEVALALSSTEVKLESRLFDQLVADGSLKVGPNKAVLRVSGNVQLRTGVLETLSVAPFETRHVLVNEGSVNELGLPWLTRFEVALDVTGRAIHLKPGLQFNRVDSLDLSGLHLLVVDKKVIVREVDENSPAWKSGILPDDEVARFQGKRVGDFHISEIRQVLRKRDGNRISLTVRRDGREKDVRFALKYGYWNNAFPLRKATR